MYVIEKIGSYSKVRYSIKNMVNLGMLIPVNGKTYANEMQAQVAADCMGLQIAATGELWELIAAARKQGMR